MSWIPGQHVYLHVPSISAGGHPFSISSICLPVKPMDSSEIKYVAKQKLLIRVREGVTRRLYNMAQDDAEAILSSDNFPSRSIYAWSEGPYGNLHHLNEYETLLLVAGGSGVSFTLPIMLDIVRRRKTMVSPSGSSEPVATSRVTFLWIIRDEGMRTIST